MLPAARERGRMKIELIAVDLDGTVLKTDKTVSRRTLKALQTAAERGVRIVPATGRVAKMVPRALLELPGVRYLLTSNGAAVFDRHDGSVLYSNTMTAEASVWLARFFVSRGYLTEAYCGGLSYANRGALDTLSGLDFPEGFYDYIMKSQIFVDDLPAFLQEHGCLLEKVNIPYVAPQIRAELSAGVLGTGDYSITSSGYDNLEINAADACKGDGLFHLCERLGIGREQVMALGDGDNDVSMLRFAGLGVAMGNAAPEVKAAADLVTETNNEDGVASAVERLVLVE